MYDSVQLIPRKFVSPFSSANCMRVYTRSGTKVPAHTQPIQSMHAPSHSAANRDPHEVAEDTSAAPRCRRIHATRSTKRSKPDSNKKRDGNQEGDQRDEKKGATTRVCKMGMPAWQVGCQ